MPLPKQTEIEQRRVTNLGGTHEYDDPNSRPSDYVSDPVAKAFLYGTEHDKTPAELHALHLGEEALRAAEAPLIPTQEQ